MTENGNTRPAEDVVIGGRHFKVQLLRLGQLKRVRDALATLFDYKPPKLPTAEQISAMAEVVHASAQLNEPTLTLEAFNAHLDELDYDTALIELGQAYILVADRSYLIKPKQPGDPEPGEAVAAPAAASTSPASTDS